MDKKITIGVLAHVDAGKTTLIEAMLFLSGELRRAGRVDHGDSFLDTDSIERDRGITIFSKQARMSSGNTEITLLDTPGHVDFSAEMERTLQVLDYAVLVISGSDGVQGHTRTLWKLLEHYRVPAFLFVNKMDLPGTKEEALLEELKESLSANCVGFLPLLSDAGGSDPDGKVQAGAEEETLEELAMCSETLLELYTEQGFLPAAEVRKAIAAREVFPVLFGSALKMEGVKTLLRELDEETLDFRSLKEMRGESPEPFGAKVFKINRDAQGQRLTWLKVTGGTLSVKDSVSYANESGETVTEKADQIRSYSGTNYDLKEQAFPGEVCAVTGLKLTAAGMGLGAEQSSAKPVLSAVMTRAIGLPPDRNPALFYKQVKVLEEEDPLLGFIWDEEHKEIRARIMGEVQIEVLTRLIEERFGVKVTFGEEHILYKETILEPVIGIGHFEPLRHYAEVQLLLEGAERGSGITVDSVCSEDVLALNWQRLILSHVLECEHPGVLTGAPLTDIKVTLLTGRAHLKHTEGGDFRQATYRAIRQGLMSAKCQLLEPYYQFTLDIPAENLGRALSDLSRMQAQGGEPLISGDRALLTGRVPVSAISAYVTEVYAYTRGQGSLTMIPDGYDLCRDAEAVLAASSYDPDADTERPSASVFCAHGAGYLVPWDQVPAMAHCEVPRDALARVREILAEEDLLPSEEELDSAVVAGSRAAKRSAENVAPAAIEEDGELLAIYQREFGMDPGSTRMDAEKSNRARNAKAGIRRKRPREGLEALTKDWTYPAIHQKIDKKGNPIYPKKDERKDCLIVDGYNILFAWEELKDLAKDNIDAAREKLLDMLSNYQGYTGQRLIVVFDAYRRDASPEAVSRHQNVEVIYTKKGETADAYIERLVHEESKSCRITVATSDSLEQLTILTMGALRMSARMLREEIGRYTVKSVLG